MGKQKKLRTAAQVEAAVRGTPEAGMKIGSFQLRPFDGADAAFGARRSDYPPIEAVPRHPDHGAYERIFSALFFGGGKLSNFGLTLKAGLDHSQAMAALMALMTSFEPQHEHKAAVVAWALREWTDGTPQL